MKQLHTGWLLYDQRDYEVNKDFASYIIACGETYGMAITMVLTETMDHAMDGLPDFVISRQRNPQRSERLEALHIPVFNNARVCGLCNDKRNTHRFLQGLPLMKTEFVEEATFHPNKSAYPLVVKPAFGHGGDRVAQVFDQAGLTAALAAIHPIPALVQQTASEAGRDLRVYVLFGRIIAAVMRTAKQGIVSNFKRGGSVALHTLTDDERTLAQAVIDRFQAQNAPLSFAGIDLIYHQGHPVVNEVEDVVGSRMLYQVSEIDCADLYLRGIADQLFT